MRCVLALLVLAACTEHGSGGIRADAPEECRSHCIADHPVHTLDDCCDSITCWFDDATDTWQVVACDPPPPDPCDSCTPDEICVQQFDGTCGGHAACVQRTVDCPDNACSAACEQAYCPSPFQCQNRSPCGGESPKAFTCYGP